MLLIPHEQLLCTPHVEGERYRLSSYTIIDDECSYPPQIVNGSSYATLGCYKTVQPAIAIATHK